MINPKLVEFFKRTRKPSISPITSGYFSRHQVESTQGSGQSPSGRCRKPISEKDSRMASAGCF